MSKIYHLQDWNIFSDKNMLENLLKHILARLAIQIQSFFMQTSIISYYCRHPKYILCMLSLKEYKIGSIFKGVHFSFPGELAAME